jgi:hypothetical protein
MALNDVALALTRLGFYNSGPFGPGNIFGFAADGHQTNFPQACADLAAVANAVSVQADGALNGPNTSGTSLSPITIGTGVRLFQIQTNKAFSLGQTVIAASSASPANQMSGVVTAHDRAQGFITLNVTQTRGVGTFSAGAH